MTPREKFQKSTVRVLLSIQDDENLSCAGCGETIVSGGDIYVFVDESGNGDTCCLKCSIPPEPKDEFEEDQ